MVQFFNPHPWRMVELHFDKLLEAAVLNAQARAACSDEAEAQRAVTRSPRC